MKEYSSLKQLIQALFPKQDDIITGVITKTSPVTVIAMGDDKLTVQPLFGKAIAGSGLKTGDKVLLLSYRGGKKYYILDRM